MTPTQNTTHLDKYETILFQKSMNVNVLFSIDEFAEIYQGALLVPEGVVGNCCHSISFWNCIHAIPCNGTLLFQCNLPRVLPVTIYKYASCLISYIVSFLILCGEWSSLVFQHFIIMSFKLKKNIFKHLLCSMMHQKKKNHDHKITF